MGWEWFSTDQANCSRVSLSQGWKVVRATSSIPMAPSSWATTSTTKRTEKAGSNGPTAKFTTANGLTTKKTVVANGKPKTKYHMSGSGVITRFKASAYWSKARKDTKVNSSTSPNMGMGLTVMETGNSIQASLKATDSMGRVSTCGPIKITTKDSLWTTKDTGGESSLWPPRTSSTGVHSKMIKSVVLGNKPTNKELDIQVTSKTT